jgi:hypothetical protein
MECLNVHAVFAHKSKWRTITKRCKQGMRRSLKRRAKTGLAHIRRLRIWACVCAYFETPVAVGVVLPVELAEPVVEPAEPVGVLVEPAAKVAYRPPCRIGVCIRLFFVSHPRVAAWLALIPGDKGELSEYAARSIGASCQVLAIRCIRRCGGSKRRARAAVAAR